MKYEPNIRLRLGHVRRSHIIPPVTSQIVGPGTELFPLPKRPMHTINKTIPERLPRRRRKPHLRRRDRLLHTPPPIELHPIRMLLRLTPRILHVDRLVIE